MAAPARSTTGEDISALVERADRAAAVHSVREAFPGTTTVVAADPLYHEATRATRREMFGTYCHRLWDGLDGFVAMFVGRDGQFTTSGRYQFDGVSEHFYEWPKQASVLADAAMKKAPCDDVYLCPMLRADRRRAQGNGVGGRHLWVDLDGEWTAERSDRLSRIMGPGSFVVASGSGRHAYIALEGVASAEKVQSLNRRLATSLDGDHKWPENSLLRPPGTFWHKGRARGEHSAIVTWTTP